MSEVNLPQRAIYERLRRTHGSEEAKAAWRTLLKRIDQQCVRRLVLIERLSENLASIALFYEPDLGSAAQRRAYELLREAIEHVIRALQPSAASGPSVALTQMFEGVVTSADKKTVRVQFMVGDDLEDRAFARRDLHMSQTIEEGQAVRARCHLEILPTTEAMSGEEIEKWKEQYCGVDGYRKKSKRGRNVLEGDEA
jgi:hypothetical protein